ncbi:INP53, partial [Symbiodinium sp. CCMP2456]
AAPAVQPPAAHVRGSGSGISTKAALGLLGCALLARRAQALSRSRIGRASAEVEEAPKRLRRRRRVPKSKPQTEITSDMLTLNTCNCDLILDTVIEFEDLLAPNEARALLDAARDTPDGFQQKLRSLSAGSKPLACEAVLGILTLNQDLFLLVVTDAVTVVDGKEAIQRVRKCEALPAGENSSEGAEAAATVTQLLEEHFYFSHSFDLTRRLQQRMEREASPSLLHADPRYVWNLSLCEPLLGQGVTERWFTPATWPK